MLDDEARRSKEASERLYATFSGGLDPQYPKQKPINQELETYKEKQKLRQRIRSEEKADKHLYQQALKQQQLEALRLQKQEEREFKRKISLEDRQQLQLAKQRALRLKQLRKTPASLKKGWGNTFLKGARGLGSTFAVSEEQLGITGSSNVNNQLKLERQRQIFALRMAKLRQQAYRKQLASRSPPPDHVRGNLQSQDESDRFLEQDLSIPEQFWGTRLVEGERHGPLWSNPQSNILNSPNVFNRQTAFSRFGQGFRNFINNQLRPAPPLSAGIGQSNRITLLANGQQTFREARQQAPRILRERPEENILNAQRLRW